MESTKWNAYVMPNPTGQTREELVGYTLIQEVNGEDRVVGIIIDADETKVVFYISQEIKLDNVEEVLIESVKTRKVDANEIQ